MTEAYKKAKRLLHKYDKTRAELRLAEEELKSALRAYSNEQNYLGYVTIDRFRATHTTSERKTA